MEALKKEVEVKEVVTESNTNEWISPLDVNYKELTDILKGGDLTKYIGKRLPKEEIERIVTDYEIYLKNK